MSEVWCFDCQNIFDAQQGHHCVHGWCIPKTLDGKEAYFSKKVKKNDCERQMTFPVSKEERSFPISVANELENEELDVSAQTDIPYLQTNSEFPLFHSSECASEKMKHQFMISNSVETCIEDRAKREKDVQAETSKLPFSRIGDNLPLESSICNSRILGYDCGTNIIPEISKIEKSSMKNSGNNNRDFLKASMNIDSLMLNKTLSDFSSNLHQQRSNVKICHLLAKNIDAFSEKEKLNTDFESKITVPNNEMVSKVVQISELSQNFSVSGHTVHDSDQNQILPFSNQIYQGDEKQIAPIEILNRITTQSIQPSFADAIAAVIRPSCSQDSERTCPIFLKEFRTKQVLKQHYQIHSGKRPFTCRICQRKFTFKSRLNQHERTVHMDEKTYKCEICGNMFSKKHYLERHFQIHMCVKHYKCDICGKLFKRKDGFVTHIRIHTGEKPYKCDICRWASTTKSNLNHHIKKYHKGT